MPFQPGNNANPNGRPRNPEIELFRKALAEVEKAKKISFLKHCVELAYDDPAMAIAILKKILPDLSSSDVVFHRVIEVIRSIPDEQLKLPHANGNGKQIQS